MVRNQSNASVRRLLSTQKYRGKKPVEKGLLLHLEEDISYDQAAKLTSVNRKAIFRAFRAKLEGRQIGVAGKPKILNQEDTQEIITRLRALKATNKVTITEVQELVEHNIIHIIFNCSYKYR